MKRRNFLSLVLFYLAGCTASQFKNSSTSSQLNSQTKQTRNPIKIVCIPWQVSVEQTKQLQPLADYLSNQLNHPFEIQIAKNYQTAVDWLVEGKVELAFLSASTYIEARRRDPKVEPLVVPINRETRRPWYTSLILTNQPSVIKSIQDLKGKRFAFVTKLSTSGYIVPMAHFQEIGIDPDRDFAAAIFAGSHHQAKELLISGAVDAIADDSNSYVQEVKSGSFDPAKYSIIWESTPIPSLPIVASSQLSESFKKALKKALMDAPEGMLDPSGAVSAGYSLSEDSDYDITRELQSRVKID